MRAPAWWTSLSLIGLAVACGDQPTEMASGPEVGPTPGAVSLAVASSDDGLAIVTDQDDYAPGDTVWFAGAGWSAGDTLDIELVDDPLTHPPHTWWVPVEGNGTFRDSTYVVDAGDVGVTFTLTAVSRATGRSLTVRFTDGNLQQIGLSPTIRTVAAGGAASYTANVRMEGDTGACAVTLSVISPLPAGAAAWVSAPNPTTVSPGNVSFSRTLTITTSVATPPKTYLFTLRAAEGSGCPTPVGTTTVNAALVVTAPSIPPASSSPPILGAIGDRTVAEETQLAFTAAATDPNGDPLTFTLAAAATGTFPPGAAITPAGAFTWTPTEAQGPGTYRVRIVVSDQGSLSDDEEIAIAVSEVNRPPVLGPIGGKAVDEGSPLSFTVTATDPDIPANALAFSLETGGNAELGSASIDPSTGLFAWTPADDNPSATPSDDYTLKVVVTDDGAGPSDLADDEQITITVNNLPPGVTGIALNPATAGYGYRLSAQPKVLASWGDPGAADTQSCAYAVKDLVRSAVVAAGLPCGTAMTAPAPGLYAIQVRVTDDDTGLDVEAFPTGGSPIVIYDPGAGYVTGGGWIASPAGACRYAACTSATTGKATFGFVSRYLGSAGVPTGSAEFHLQAANLTFRSSGFEWLVVNAGAGRAQLQGSGTINGTGLYGITLRAYDGSPDRLRIRIWDRTSGVVAYDNGAGGPASGSSTALGGGSLVVHPPGK